MHRLELLPDAWGAFLAAPYFSAAEGAALGRVRIGIVMGGGPRVEMGVREALGRVLEGYVEGSDYRYCARERVAGVLGAVVGRSVVEGWGESGGENGGKSGKKRDVEEGDGEWAGLVGDSGLFLEVGEVWRGEGGRGDARRREWGDREGVKHVARYVGSCLFAGVRWLGVGCGADGCGIGLSSLFWITRRRSVGGGVVNPRCAGGVRWESRFL